MQYKCQIIFGFSIEIAEIMWELPLKSDKFIEKWPIILQLELQPGKQPELPLVQMQMIMEDAASTPPINRGAP